MHLWYVYVCCVCVVCVVCECVWYVGVWYVCGVVCVCVLYLCGMCVVCVCVQLSDQGDDFEDVISEPRLGESEGHIACTSGKSIPSRGNSKCGAPAS